MEIQTDGPGEILSEEAKLYLDIRLDKFQVPVPERNFQAAVDDHELAVFLREVAPVMEQAHCGSGVL